MQKQKNMLILYYFTIINNNISYQHKVTLKTKYIVPVEKCGVYFDMSTIYKEKSVWKREMMDVSIVDGTIMCKYDIWPFIFAC